MSHKKKKNKKIVHTFEGQHEDEIVQFTFRRHIVVLRRPLIAMMVALMLGCLPMLFWPTSSWVLILVAYPLIGLAVGVIIFWYFWIGWFYSIFIVTDSRFIQIKQKGFFNRSVIDLGLDKIQNINFSIDGLQQTLLKFGTIVIQTFVGDLVLSNVGHPQEIHSRLLSIVKDSGSELPDELKSSKK